MRSAPAGAERFSRASPCPGVDPARATRALAVLAACGVLLAALLAVRLAGFGVVVVRGGSMMHAGEDVAWGRVGTIDPGDAVLVRRGGDALRTWVEGGEARFGAPGDVVLFAPEGDLAHRPVLHRLVLWVEVRGAKTSAAYEFAWPEKTRACVAGRCVFGPEGVYFPPLEIDERYGFTPSAGWKPASSGYVTKGDNPVVNRASDVANGIACPSLDGAARTRCPAVAPEWILGVVAFEIPWMGLPKLAFASEPNLSPQGRGWLTIGAATAPVDHWAALALVLLAPLAGFVGLAGVRRLRAR